jgi:hypothetical protein
LVHVDAVAGVVPGQLVNAGLDRAADFYLHGHVTNAPVEAPVGTLPPRTRLPV